MADTDKPATFVEEKSKSTRLREPEPEPVIEVPRTYVEASWGGNKKYQCVFCPWDSIGSPTDEFDALTRMLEHQAAAHLGYSGPEVYGANGLPIGTT